MLWERSCDTKVVVSVDSRVLSDFELCHDVGDVYAVRLVYWSWEFDMDFKDFCMEKKETSKSEFELWVGKGL